jgi:serine protease inhibitor
VRVSFIQIKWKKKICQPNKEESVKVISKTWKLSEILLNNSFKHHIKHSFKRKVEALLQKIICKHFIRKVNKWTNDLNDRMSNELQKIYKFTWQIRSAFYNIIYFICRLFLLPRRQSSSSVEWSVNSFDHISTLNIQPTNHLMGYVIYHM